jgi:transcriptional regulator with XRE-family HTH domain
MVVGGSPGAKTRLHQYLRAWRINSFMSMRDFVAHMDIAESTYRGWETGARRMSLDDFQRVADAHGVVVARLLYHPDEPKLRLPRDPLPPPDWDEPSTRRLTEQEIERLRMLRGQGLSWEKCGELLGISGRTLWSKWGTLYLEAIFPHHWTDKMDRDLQRLRMSGLSWQECSHAMGGIPENELRARWDVLQRRLKKHVAGSVGEQY